MLDSISFCIPTLRGKELDYIREAIEGGQIAANGPFSKRVETLLEMHFGACRVLLTQSCTAALEIAALLTVEQGNEVIMPSFTLCSTATAFARAGATPVFVDICPDTLNIDPREVEAAITPQTRVIVAMHYGGVSCDMGALQAIADAYNLTLVADAAHAYGASYRDRPLASFGNLSALSFNHQKNVTSGQGGALVVNDPTLVTRSQIIRDRGTDQDRFLQGKTAMYTWVELGSNYAQSDILSAFLLAQIESAEQITADRLRLWQRYHHAFAALERSGTVRRPVVPREAGHNAHIYYLLLNDPAQRPSLLLKLKENGIYAMSHFVPLHGSPAGLKYGRTAGALAVTEKAAQQLVRLPLHLSMTEREQDAVIENVTKFLSS